MMDIPSTGAAADQCWHSDESARASVIAEHHADLLQDDQSLKQITRFAAALCNAPIAMISLVEERRQLFLARTGLDVSETPRETSFCAHAMLMPELMVVPDATRDPRFATNPLVTGDTQIRFYAGAPLITREGVPLGALCVIDTVPREGLTPLQQQGLLVLAADVMTRLTTSRTAAASQFALSESEQRFRTLADAMPQMVWSTLPDGYHDYYNARWYEFTGMPVGSTDGEEWNGMFHPEDQDRAWALWRHSLDTGEPYQIEYRLRRADGAYRWTLGRALPIRDAGGAITRWFGTCTDIHEQKLASEEREVIAQELSHRIKNIFSVISGLIAFSARADRRFTPIADQLRERVTALGRAHDFVRPHSARSRPAAAQTSLHGLLGELFKPYGDRITVSGDEVKIDDRSATPIALLFHELATNATKYGALTADDGHVEVTCLIDADQVVLTWVESGGPLIAEPPTAPGFGTQLVELSAVRQLGGTVAREWRRDGLRLTARVPLSAFSR